jgi:ABC-type transport system involved in multi-copper enzyme maturation permease subunit
LGERHAVRWLLADELRRSWISYLGTALLTVVVALFALALVSGFYATGGDLSFFVDMYLLLMFANLALNWAAANYWRPADDMLSERLRFLRALPVTLRELVASRIAAMVALLAVTAPIFFLVLYLLSGDLRGELNPARYLAFVGIWSGYALVMGALGLYLEWGFSGNTLFKLQLVWTAALVAVALVASLLGFGIFAWTVDLARSYGALPAILALLSGAAALALSGRETARRLGRRDL